MRVLEKGAPAAAILAALSAFACCLPPLGFLAGLGFASLSVWVEPLRFWLIGASIVFLCVGFAQLYFRKSCRRRSVSSLVLFWIAFAVVALMLVFPQVFANLIAG